MTTVTGLPVVELGQHRAPKAPRTTAQHLQRDIWAFVPVTTEKMGAGGTEKLGLTGSSNGAAQRLTETSES